MHASLLGHADCARFLLEVGANVLAMSTRALSNVNAARTQRGMLPLKS